MIVKEIGSRDSGCVFFFFGYSLLFCRSTKKKKVTRKNIITTNINGNFGKLFKRS